jgi:hypothetical protein
MCAANIVGTTIVPPVRADHAAKIAVHVVAENACNVGEVPWKGPLVGGVQLEMAWPPCARLAPEPRHPSMSGAFLFDEDTAQVRRHAPWVIRDIYGTAALRADDPTNDRTVDGQWLRDRRR